MGQITIKYPNIDNPRFQQVMEKEGITAEALTKRMKDAIRTIFVVPGKDAGGCYFHADVWYAKNGGYPGGPADCVSYLFAIGRNVNIENGTYTIDKFTGSSEAESLLTILTHWEGFSVTIEGEEWVIGKLGELTHLGGYPKDLGKHPEKMIISMKEQLQPSIDHIDTMIWSGDITIREVWEYIKKHNEMIRILIAFVPYLWYNKEREDIWKKLQATTEDLSMATDLGEMKTILKEQQTTATEFLKVLDKIKKISDKDRLPKQLQPSLEHLSTLREDCKEWIVDAKEVNNYLSEHQKLVRVLIGILNDTRWENASYKMKVWEKFKADTTKIRELRQKAQYAISHNIAEREDYKEFDAYMIEYKKIIDKFLITLNQTKEDPTTPDMSAES